MQTKTTKANFRHEEPPPETDVLAGLWIMKLSATAIRSQVPSDNEVETDGEREVARFKPTHKGPLKKSVAALAESGKIHYCSIIFKHPHNVLITIITNVLYRRHCARSIGGNYIFSDAPI